MSPYEISPARSQSVGTASLGTQARPARLAFRWADVVAAPLHDFPIRDEILFQYLAFPAGADVLEVGPGSGFTAFRLAPHVRSITLLDVAPRSIEGLRQTLWDQPNIRYVCADATSGDVADRLGRTFDVAFGLDMFEYVRDPAACLRNLASVLRPGGELFLTFPNVPPPVGDGVTYFSDLGALETLLRQADFSAWRIFVVRRRRWAAAVYTLFHDWPLRLYRRVRSGDRKARPQVYEATWAFQHRNRLLRFKVLFHLFWAVLGWSMRLAGDIFTAESVGGRPLGRQLVVRATK